MLFGELEHLVELLAEHVMMRLVALHRIEKCILAPSGFASLALNGCFDPVAGPTNPCTITMNGTATQWDLVASPESSCSSSCRLT